MALRRVLPALRPYIPRFAPLSTAPAASEQSAAGPGAVPGRGSARAVRPLVPAVDFGNALEAYCSRRTWELARSLLVLRLCAWPALLARHEQESVAKMGIASRAEIEDWFMAETLGVSGTVDLLDWSSLIDSRTKLSKHLVVPNAQTGQPEPLLSRFAEEEELQITRMLQRMDVLAKKATEMGVRLMVDAEQTYFQPAISRLTLEMQRKFNVEKPLIFNIYQCYLKDAYDNVTLDVELARHEGWCFGAKLVRGAYLAQERARAAEIGYEDPINPMYEATNAVYHRCLDYVLEELKHNTKAKVMVASHNEDTVRFALRRMEELGLHPADHQVYFGQLLGMCDQISFPLGQAGYPVYKYVPYGPVMEVLPYLSRRALENSSLMKGTHRERQLLWLELLRRLRTGNLFHRPA
ncbi:proline dehydrogenase 1, mitochondrial-like [Gorilla gorilla gorilla]|uniref:proline dehydrogenase 1, mitochondrial-like n=1 Tax=Gorilla gorilla gorilla TaxID=9595 RepID=UPI0024458A63|nr:proline dehydrogenase 1, mitochondrial-like [Gorilla gorilla gorilla]